MSQVRDRSQSSVSLFPFLAVLICTMGALIVLLVIVVQQARTVHATEVAVPSPPPEDPEELLSAREKLEDLRWQIKQVDANREKAREKLREQQLQLSLAEDQVRSLQSQIERLEKEAQSLELAQGDRISGSSAIAEQIQKLRENCDRLQQEVEELRSQGSKRSRQFAVIPYKGPNGTDRRPIYVECFADQAVLQPEGITFTPADFPADMDSENPLAVALRGTREYWLNHGITTSAGDAYPLLIVRPEGARMYAACRSALKGWDDEFGYELVTASMELAYSPSDPSLAAFLQTSVDEVRNRLNRSNEEWQAAHHGSPQNGPMGLVPPTESGSSATAHANSNIPGDGYASSGTGGAGKGSENPGWSANSTKGAGTGAEDGGEPSSPNAVSSVNADAAATAGLQSIAATRGENWALPNIAGNSLAISRSVLVTCTPSALLLEPEIGVTKPPEAFPFEGTTRTAIQPFVNALWREIENWGVAGPGAYWRPTLKIAIAESAAESRFADLAKLLEGSGLIVERR